MKKLVITILVVAIVLFGTSFALRSTAEENAQAEHLWLLQTLLPDSTDFVLEPYTGEDANIQRVWKADTGYIVETVTYGYAGNITMLIGVHNDGYVTGLQIRDMEETYGLGAEALTDWEFLAQFLRTEGDAEVGTNIGSVCAEESFYGQFVGKSEADYRDVDAISGATVTSKAIARSVNSAVGFVTGADTSSSATSWGG